MPGLFQSTVRAAERIRIANTIAADPCPAKFRLLTPFNVRLFEPAKTRDLRLGGFTLAGVGEVAMVALPLGTARPEPTTETISIVDYSGQWLAYDIKSVEALRGTDCYNLGLAIRRARPTGSSPTVVG